MFCRFTQFSVLFLLAMAVMVYAADLMGTKQTVVYGECNNCGNGYGRCMGVKHDSVGRYAVCEAATVYGCGFGEVGPRFYLPDNAEAHIRRELLDTCGRVLTMDGYNRLERDRVYIDLIYKDSTDLDCAPAKALAEALLEAKRVECESDEGSEFFGEIKEKKGRWCVSGRCNACESKWRDNLVNAAKQECCDMGSEPEPDRGVCLNPKESPDKGIGGSSLYLLPKCTDKSPDYESGNSFCEPPPSSSSSEAASSSSGQSSSSEEVSSSSNEPSSSSEDISSSSELPPPSSSSSLVACFREEPDAQREKERLELSCLAEQGRPDFGIDDRNCLWGQCDRPSSSSSERSSSSEGASSSSSSSSSGNNDICSDGTQLFLQKPVNYYDDWVYIGKESYGSRHATRSSLKPGTKFFDVLGRAYDKMKARIKYYVFKDAVKRDVHETQLEFEVWARIIKDSEGNDIQVFIKEDKRNRLRKDSSFYYDGYWEVFEFDDAANETRFKASSGIRSLRKYDDKDRLTERYMVDGNGDTLTSEKYEWKNGRLIKTKIDGVERVYIYGKTLQDTIYVQPSDNDLNYHFGYNGTTGKIPGEGTPDYEIFAMNPYGHMAFGEEGYDESESPVVYFAAKNSVSGNSGQLNILKKIISYGCVNEKEGMPKAQCIRYERKDIPLNAPQNGLYGHSDFKLSLKFECKCNAFGKHQPSFSGNTINEKIEVFQSVWRYNDEEKYWHEHCRLEENLQRTYNHEVQHIRNGRHIAITLNSYANKDGFNTKNECEKEGKKESKKLMEKWDEWYKREQAHINPSSPEVGRDRFDYLCN